MTKDNDILYDGIRIVGLDKTRINNCLNGDSMNVKGLRQMSSLHKVPLLHFCLRMAVQRLPLRHVTFAEMLALRADNSRHPRSPLICPHHCIPTLVFSGTCFSTSSHASLASSESSQCPKSAYPSDTSDPKVQNQLLKLDATCRNVQPTVDSQLPAPHIVNQTAKKKSREARLLPKLQLAQETILHLPSIQVVEELRDLEIPLPCESETAFLEQPVRLRLAPHATSARGLQAAQEGLASERKGQSVLFIEGECLSTPSQHPIAARRRRALD